MPIRMSTVKALCTKPEVELVLETSPARLAEATPKQLAGGIARARRLRDKYKDLAARQRREARGKDVPRGRRPSLSNENTVRKQEIFDAVLEKFEAQLARVEKRDGNRPTRQLPRTKTKVRKDAADDDDATTKRASATPAPKSAARWKAAALLSGNGSPEALTLAKAPKQKGQGLLARSEATKGVRTTKAMQRGNLTAIQGHISARGRRSQARRDSR